MRFFLSLAFFSPLLLLTILGGGMARAHVVEQFYAELIPEKDGIEILFDLGYANPETRGDPDEPQPQLTWLLEQSEAELESLKKRSEDFLRESLHFSQDGEKIGASYHFVDFEQDPPSYRRMLTGGAYFRILVTPTTSHFSAPVICHLAEGERPMLVIKLAKEDYLTLEPGENFLLKESTGRPFALHAWVTGFAHVLPLGLDHLCFILALFFFQRNLRQLLLQSLTFTAAHTLTLGLSASQLIPQAGAWVEIVIPLSIAAVAVENLRKKDRTKQRLLIIFLFGLIHGVGFAGALQRLFPEDHTFLPFLLLTNLGIESAQVVILLAAWLCTLPFAQKPYYEKIRRSANYLLILFALAWCIQRF